MFGLRKIKEVPEENKLRAVRDLLLAERKFTHDTFWLQQRANWLVFLYCDMQKGHPQPANQCDLVWWGFTKPKYSLWKNDLGKLAHPVAFEEDPRLSKVGLSRIKGQIVRMRTDRLIQLDVQRQNGVQFLRKRIPITVPSIVKDMQYNDERRNIPCEDTVWAWAYIGNTDFWMDEPISVSKIKTVSMPTARGDFEKKISYDYLMSAHLRSKTMQTVKKYRPNNNNNEPYFYYAPTE